MAAEAHAAPAGQGLVKQRAHLVLAEGVVRYVLGLCSAAVPQQPADPCRRWSPQLRLGVVLGLVAPVLDKFRGLRRRARGARRRSGEGGAMTRRRQPTRAGVREGPSSSPSAPSAGATPRRGPPPAPPAGGPTLSRPRAQNAVAWPSPLPPPRLRPCAPQPPWTRLIKGGCAPESNHELAPRPSPQTRPTLPLRCRKLGTPSPPGCWTMTPWRTRPPERRRRHPRGPRTLSCQVLADQHAWWKWRSAAARRSTGLSVCLWGTPRASARACAGIHVRCVCVWCRGDRHPVAAQGPAKTRRARDRDPGRVQAIHVRLF